MIYVKASLRPAFFKTCQNNQPKKTMHEESSNEKSIEWLIIYRLHEFVWEEFKFEFPHLLRCWISSFAEIILEPAKDFTYKLKL